MGKGPKELRCNKLSELITRKEGKTLEEARVTVKFRHLEGEESSSFRITRWVRRKSETGYLIDETEVSDFKIIERFLLERGLDAKLRHTVILQS